MPHMPGDGNTVRASHSQSIHISFGVVVGSSPAMFVSHGVPIMIEVVRLIWFHNLAEDSTCFRTLHKTCISMFVVVLMHIQELHTFKCIRLPVSIVSGVAIVSPSPCENCGNVLSHGSWPTRPLTASR